MAVARIGLCGQIGDAPSSIRGAQQDAQDGCRLRGEDGAQRTRLGAGLVSNGALNVNGTERQPRVAGKIEVGDIVVGADGARLWRQVGADKDGYEVAAAVRVTGLAQSRHAALELIDPRTDGAGGSVRLHLDDERIASPGAAQTDQSIDTARSADLSLTLDRLDRHARYVAEQVANRIHGANLQFFHYFGTFQHMLKIAPSVK
jgi:hypothetical protein